MTVAPPSDIDRLIEDGLSRYGAGDLDGALAVWEQVLDIDPSNQQAISYVDYVRTNYALLSRDEPEVSDGGAPFGIVEEPEYQIEIVPGEMLPGEAAPLYMDPLDHGWYFEEETKERVAPVEIGEVLELEADEPPPHEFEGTTREYPDGPRRPGSAGDFPPEAPTSEFLAEETTGGFRGDHGTPGFTSQVTDVRKRDLGFVKASAPPNAELKVTVRTPEVPAPAVDKPSAKVSIGSAPTIDIADRTEERPPLPKAVTHDLVKSLPSPRPAPTVPPATEIKRVPTRELPEPARAPARKLDDGIAYGTAATRDLERVPPPPPMFGTVDDPLVAAPTRELGLRPSGRAATGLGDDDEVPTKQSDARAFRDEVARSGQSRAVSENTKHDIVPPFDPIDARSAQILDDVDADTPPDESHEDRTRRRISGLFERAVAWNGITDFEKAVTAVDLALSEDPTSPLAQKLIHRNRDTIMTVFQNFLGDLERQPQLARPLHELASAPISPRAAFLLSRIDGQLTLDEILDVSGMPRMEAYRHLCQLFLRGILR